MIPYAHSGFRYLVILAGLIVIGYAAFGMVTGRPYDKTMRVTYAAFVGFLDLQVLLGIVYFVSSYRFTSRFMGHLFPMVLALIAAHVVSAVMKRRPEEERTYRPHLFGTLVALALIVLGIKAIPADVFPLFGV